MWHVLYAYSKELPGTCVNLCWRGRELRYDGYQEGSRYSDFVLLKTGAESSDVAANAKSNTKRSFFRAVGNRGEAMRSNHSVVNASKGSRQRVVKVVTGRGSLPKATRSNDPVASESVKRFSSSICGEVQDVCWWTCAFLQAPTRRANVCCSMACRKDVQRERSELYAPYHLLHKQFKEKNH